MSCPTLVNLTTTFIRRRTRHETDSSISKNKTKIKFVSIHDTSKSYGIARENLLLLTQFNPGQSI